MPGICLWFIIPPPHAPHNGKSLCRPEQPRDENDCVKVPHVLSETTHFVGNLWEGRLHWFWDGFDYHTVNPYADCLKFLAQFLDYIICKHRVQIWFRGLVVLAEVVFELPVKVEMQSCFSLISRNSAGNELIFWYCSSSDLHSSPIGSGFLQVTPNIEMLQRLAKMGTLESANLK